MAAQVRQPLRSIGGWVKWTILIGVQQNGQARDEISTAVLTRRSNFEATRSPVIRRMWEMVAARPSHWLQ